MDTRIHYRRTRSTTDPAAIEINRELNDVLARIAVGHKLRDLLKTRFHGNGPAFRRWVTEHLDCSAQSAGRYLALAEYENILVDSGLIDLTHAYDLLGIKGNIGVDDPVWQVQVQEAAA